MDASCISQLSQILSNRRERFDQLNAAFQGGEEVHRISALGEVLRFDLVVNHRERYLGFTIQNGAALVRRQEWDGDIIIEVGVFTIGNRFKPHWAFRKDVSPLPFVEDQYTTLYNEAPSARYVFTGSSTSKRGIPDHDQEGHALGTDYKPEYAIATCDGYSANTRTDRIAWAALKAAVRAAGSPLPSCQMEENKDWEVPLMSLGQSVDL